ncbi:MAG: hypothetical protein EZS28_052895 [Streblomastix strix]|uniref:Uncharacterized protein n=1 Tax=Streblomastix strix TaxID=222440 RepID=A0A5J4RRA9_9EUKA|nr:MAG: hypothetical protein EZS28_052895 [Streblomastix strix]
MNLGLEVNDREDVTQRIAETVLQAKLNDTVNNQSTHNRIKDRAANVQDLQFTLQMKLTILPELFGDTQ